MEGRILNAVAIYLSYVKVFLNFLDLVRDDVIGSAPDTIAVGFTLLLKHEDMNNGWLEWEKAHDIVQRLPERPFDQCYDSARCFRCTTVVLASVTQSQP